MSKDPAILFYTGDFLNGCTDLTFEERGQYITLLCLQHQKGHLSEKTIRLTVGSVSVDVLKKFIKDEEGNYYNDRMDEEIKKRQHFLDTRYFNGKKGGRPSKPNRKPNRKPNKEPTENLSENEDENEDTNNKGAKKFNFDFVEEQFKDVFNSWLQYKKERKETYKTQTSLEACYKNLKKLSGNNPETAKEIIENSFANNWSGLFAIKNNKPFTPAPIVPEFSSGPDK